MQFTEVYAWVARDKDGNEGIPAVNAGNGHIIPLVSAHRERIELLRPSALGVLDEPGATVSLIRFTTREVLEEHGPREEEPK